MSVSNEGMAGPEGPPAPRIVVVNRHALFGFLLREVLISHFPKYDVVAVAEAREVPASEGGNQLIVLSVEASVVDDLQLLRPTPVLLLSQVVDADLVDFALACGCRGLLDSNSSVELAIATVQLILAGGTHFPALAHAPMDFTDPAFDHAGRSTAADPYAARLADGAHSMPDLAAEDGSWREKLGLTSREHQVLQELCQGHPNKIIARNLNITENTAKMHVRRILAKLQAKNRTEAVLMFRAKSAKNSALTSRLLGSSTIAKQ